MERLSDESGWNFRPAITYSLVGALRRQSYVLQLLR
jgi:hypothetical protein